VEVWQGKLEKTKSQQRFEMVDRAEYPVCEISNGHRFEPFPFPIYFVHPYVDRWADIVKAADPPNPDLIYQRFVESNDIWVMQTYLHLRRQGLDVRHTSQLRPGAINVIMNYDLGIRQLPYRSYVVACRADTFRSRICHHTIVQNPHNLLSATDHLVHHWPQPGLLRRDASRGRRLKTIAYMGNGINLWSQFRTPQFERALKKIGVNFHINEDPGKFHDYREYDATIAVRDLTESDYFSKPASKLVNAWHAGVPALLGPEPAFQALRKTSLDYLEIRSTDEAVNALIRLREDPELYHRMVENGLMRAREFTSRRIVARWREVLAGPVAEGFSIWSQRSAIRKSLVSPALFVIQAAWNIQAKSKYVHQRDHGFRPISGRFT
jgi:hypothetical protein